ncbi:magnesium transporter [Candidatus Woesearchaeota archaeon]|nr:magnesium transporter [Candidatus Woesearchaeota archaeon]
MFTVREIFRESIGVLLVSIILGLIAGMFLRNIQDSLIVILPLIIMLPALNGMIGNYGIIVTSKITTALDEKKVKNIHSHIIKHLFKDIIPVALFSAVYISILSTFIAYFKGFEFSYFILSKIMLITIVTTLSLVIFIFIVAVIGSLVVYKKGIDPEDVLIPITTSIADVFSIGIFSLLVSLLF